MLSARVCDAVLFGVSPASTHPKVEVGQVWKTIYGLEIAVESITTSAVGGRLALLRENSSNTHYMSLWEDGSPRFTGDWTFISAAPPVAWIVTAFDSLATAMRTPQGRRLLLVQAVEDAVRNCSAELNRDAYRVALVSRLDYTNRKDAVFDPMVAAYFASTIAADCVAGNSDVYNSAIKSHASPSGPWTARRSAKTRSSGR